MTLAAESPAETTRFMSLGNIRLNLDTFQVLVGDVPIAATFLEFELLKVLIGQSDRIISLDNLTQLLWHDVGRQYIRRLNVIVFRLRNKLEHATPYELATVRGRGYGLLSEPHIDHRRKRGSA